MCFKIFNSYLYKNIQIKFFYDLLRKKMIKKIAAKINCACVC